MKKLIFLITLHASLFTLHVTEAQIIHVPAEQPTIQAGINEATDGDTVLVAEGTFLENINFVGKNITVASEFILDGDESHIENTVIDGSNTINPDYGSVVYFKNGEDSTAILQGFTITGGTGTWVPTDNIRTGGGVYIENSGAKIINNHIIDNEVQTLQIGSGGGITVGDATNNFNYIVIRHNVISNNVVIGSYFAEGGGISLYSHGIIEDNIITNNEISSETLNAVGGGIRAFGVNESRFLLCVGNIISENTIYSGSLTSYGGAAGLQAYNRYGKVSDNTIQFNQIISDVDGGVGAGLHFGFCSGDMVCENNFIADNNAGTSGLGGGISTYSSNIKIINNIIVRNIAQYGAGIHNHFNMNGTTQIINNTIASNVWEGVFIEEANAVILNTIIWDNGVEISQELSNIEVAYSNVNGGWPGEGNIDADPDFMDDSCHIDESSPCANNGVDSLEFGGYWYYSPESDFDEEERPFPSIYCDPVPDIGADEIELDCEGISDLTQHSTLNIDIFPNPTGGISHFTFHISQYQYVTLKISDIHGREVATVLDKKLPAGEHTVRFDASGLPDGVYFVRVTAGREVAVSKLVVHYPLRD